MSNSVAEAYLLIVRESNVPIFGEAVPMPFTGQIELDAWSWEVKNRTRERKKEEDDRRELELKGGGKGVKGATSAKGSAGTSGSGAKGNAALFKPDGLIRQVTDTQKNERLTQQQRDKKVQELIKTAVAGYADAASDATDNDTDKDEPTEYEKGAMTLTFEKGVDLATTPLLSALARGEILPKAILTLFHRATNAPVTLAITMADIRLKSCDISCDPDDKMADLKEKWTATYQRVDWMYQNRPAAAGPNFLTKGTVRVFVMKEQLASLV
jgi:type VI protein secretion system component Hcp